MNIFIQATAKKQLESNFKTPQFSVIAIILHQISLILSQLTGILIMTTPSEKQEDNTSSEQPQDNTSSVARLKALHPTANAVVVICAIIMLWRGVWELLNLYFFPGSPTFSNLLSIALGALILHLDDFSLKDLKR